MYGFKKSGLLELMGAAVVVVGCAQIALGQYEIIDVGTLGGTYSAAVEINDYGEIAGTSAYQGSATRHAFLYIDGSMIDLGTLGGRISRGQAINNAGQVAGDAERVDSPSHAFLYSGGSMIDLGTLPGGIKSFADGINDLGHVVGESRTSGHNVPHAFLYADGVMTDLGTLGGTESWAWAINNWGQVVGCSHVSGDFGGNPSP